MAAVDDLSRPMQHAVRTALERMGVDPSLPYDPDAHDWRDTEAATALGTNLGALMQNKHRPEFQATSTGHYTTLREIASSLLKREWTL